MDHDQDSKSLSRFCCWLCLANDLSAVARVSCDCKRKREKAIHLACIAKILQILGISKGSRTAWAFGAFAKQTHFAADLFSSSQSGKTVEYFAPHQAKLPDERTLRPRCHSLPMRNSFHGKPEKIAD